MRHVNEMGGFTVALFFSTHQPETPKQPKKCAVTKKSASQDRVYGAFVGWASFCTAKN